MPIRNPVRNPSAVAYFESLRPECLRLLEDRLATMPPDHPSYHQIRHAVGYLKGGGRMGKWATRLAAFEVKVCGVEGCGGAALYRFGLEGACRRHVEEVKAKTKKYHNR